MTLIVLTDCAGDSVAITDLSAHWAALTGQTASIQPLPVALRPEDHIQTTSYASHALYRALRAASQHIGRQPYATGFAVNGAPRDGQYPNGVPFCYFKYGAHTVTAPFNGHVLRMVRRYLGVTEVELVDIEEVLRAAQAWGEDLSEEDVSFIVHEKFRSLWFQLRFTHWLLSLQDVPSRRVPVPVPEDDEVSRVSFTDGFGNVFFNLECEELGLRPGDVVSIRGESVTCHQDFTDVAVGEPAMLVGYSFPMLVVSCGDAATRFGLKPGDPVELRIPEIAGTNGYRRPL